LSKKNYIHQLQKLNHPKATKKIYLCDTSIRLALSPDKHFGRRFENMIYLELLKSNIECFYDEGIDFYLPNTDEVILGMPFVDERSLFKKIEAIEAFIFTYQIKKVTAVTMSREGEVSHPLSHVEMLPFDIWAIGD
jgi:predicted AAA+ superfamily ATPase